MTTCLLQKVREGNGKMKKTLNLKNCINVIVKYYLYKRVRKKKKEKKVT